MAEGIIPTGVMTTMDTLLDGEIAVSGGTTWQTASHTVAINPYKYLFIKISVYGATYNDVIVPMDVFRKITTSIDFAISVYWTYANIGTLSIRSNGRVSVSAKTQDLKFVYTIYGLK